MSPLQRLKCRVGRFRYFKWSEYDNILDSCTSFVALFCSFSLSSVWPIAWGDQNKFDKLWRCCFISVAPSVSWWGEGAWEPQSHGNQTTQSHSLALQCTRGWSIICIANYICAQATLGHGLAAYISSMPKRNMPHSQKMLLNVAWMTNFQPLLCVRHWVWPRQTHTYVSLYSQARSRFYQPVFEKLGWSEEGFPIPTRKLHLQSQSLWVHVKEPKLPHLWYDFGNFYHMDVENDEVKVWAVTICGCPWVTLGAASLYR